MKEKEIWFTEKGKIRLNQLIDSKMKLIQSLAEDCLDYSKECIELSLLKDLSKNYTEK